MTEARIKKACVGERILRIRRKQDGKEAPEIRSRSEAG